MDRPLMTSLMARMHTRATSGRTPRPLSAYRKAAATCPEHTDHVPAALIACDGELGQLVVIGLADLERLLIEA